ncbi:hypothetical protein CsSME_00015302 [Camellia sinensis var. sinensis]
MAMTTKDHTPIEIKAPQPRVSIDFASDELGREQRVPFFRPLSQRRENTWIISLFVILHLVAFAATMIVNDCWKNSHRDCALKPLGRLSFQPLSENPLLGPSSSLQLFYVLAVSGWIQWGQFDRHFWQNITKIFGIFSLAHGCMGGLSTLLLTFPVLSLLEFT